MRDANCLFCQIVEGKEPAQIVWENEEFVAIKNKYPVAKIHILVIPKDHIEKKKLAAGNGGEFWSKMMVAVFSVIRLKALDQTGYKLVNNGAGYNHFEHEHMHILGGTKEEPVGKT